MDEKLAVVLTDEELEALLQDLPAILKELLIEDYQKKRSLLLCEKLRKMETWRPPSIDFCKENTSK